MSRTPIDIIRISKALADRQRLELLERMAKDGELTCSDLVEGGCLAQATVSHHLKELVNAGLAVRRKEGQFAHFSLRTDLLQAYLLELRRRLGLKA